MEYLNIDFVIDIHDRVLNKYGGMQGIKDYGALESTVNNPFVTFFGEDLYKTDVDKISNIFFLLIKNHCFNDANKRTAIVVFNILTKINKINLEYKIKELETLALDIAENKIDSDKATQWIFNHINN